MRVMAAPACRGVGMTGFDRKTMHAGTETLRLPGVATVAVHRRDHEIVIGMFHRDAGVTTDAVVGAVNG